jgi:transcriptional regulator with XRE-family HTH domain
MRTAETIRAHRVRAGKSAQQVAAELGINDAWYADLEMYDDELASTLTLFQAKHLATILGVQLSELLVENEHSGRRIGLLDLPSIIRKHIEVEALSMEEFEDLIGWDIKGFLDSPVASAAELPIMFLRDLANHLDVSLLSLLVEDHAH